MKKNSLLRGLCLASALFTFIVTIAMFFLDVKTIDIETLKQMMVGTTQIALCSFALVVILLNNMLKN